jgi:uncharacterized protein
MMTLPPFQNEPMNLIRLIAVAVIFWLIYRLILTLLNKTRRPEPPPRDGTMVRCEQCDLHIPQEQALIKDGKTYCSEEHRDAGEA